MPYGYWDSHRESCRFLFLFTGSKINDFGVLYKYIDFDKTLMFFFLKYQMIHDFKINYINNSIQIIKYFFFFFFRCPGIPLCWRERERGYSWVLLRLVCRSCWATNLNPEGPGPKQGNRVNGSFVMKPIKKQSFKKLAYKQVYELHWYLL
jgi:hypothetical protein